ncbi:MAG: 2-C-methyl-D-erythritol 4-phosphate cytidylyltransferase [Tangfeifania sp.]
MKKLALIVAGGSGSRMKGELPKQFLELNGKPVLIRTFEAFLKYDRNIQFVLVLPEVQLINWKKLCVKYDFNLKHSLVPGGETRFHSVQNGLSEINEDGIVFIHDGVRPLVSVQTIENCYKTANEKGNALPVVSPSESVRELINGGSRAVDRSRFFLVQTPQTFNISVIKKAYEQDYLEKFTDDASVLENTGQQINLVAGNRENIKITYPEDLLIASAFCEKI